MRLAKSKGKPSKEESQLKSTIEIQELQNEVAKLEVQISKPLFEKAALSVLIKKYCVLIEHYNGVKNTRKSNFYMRR